VDTQSLRNYTRAQLEVDDEELPDAILNVYLQDAFERTIAMDNRWPRNEGSWSLSQLPGNDGITCPPDMNIPSVMSVVATDNGYRLAIIAHENAEDQFVPINSSGYVEPLYVSFWAGKMHLWPRLAPEQSFDIQVRAYTQPIWDNTASAIPDLDPRLHIALCYYAIALAYSAQEDEVLEGVYMARWNRDVMQSIRAIMEPVHNHPLVLHGGSRIGGTPSYVIIPPTGA